MCAMRSTRSRKGLAKSFEVEDEPYFIELQAPASAQILLTADYGAAGRWPVVEKLYGTDTSVQSDGKTRVLGYTRQIGGGAVTYLALGHCHNPYSRMGRTAGRGQRAARDVQRAMGIGRILDPTEQCNRLGDGAIISGLVRCAFPIMPQG